MKIKMLNLPNFNEIYNSYHNQHKFYTHDELMKKYPEFENNAYMFVNEDSKDKFVIGEKYVDDSLWFTTKDVLQTIEINNKKKNEALYMVKVELCKDAHFNRSPQNIVTTNKIIMVEMKLVKVVKKLIVFD